MYQLVMGRHQRCYRHGKDRPGMARGPCEDVPECLMLVFSTRKVHQRAVCYPCMSDNKRAYRGRYVILPLYATDKEVEAASTLLEVTSS